VTKIRNSAVIRCTPEEAFDFLSDHRSELEWNPACQEMAKLTDGPVGVGTRYRAKWKAGPRVELETVTFDRPREWSVHNGGPIELLFTCTLDPVPDGTRLTAEFEPTPHGMFRIVYPLFRLNFQRQEKKNMSYLKETLERRASVKAED
jgi:hypothetical protein